MRGKEEGMIVTIIAFLVCAGIPLGGAGYLLYRRDGTVLSFIVGAAGFWLSQLVLRSRFLGFLGTESTWFMTAAYTDKVLYFLFMAFTAGVFEECARWLGMGIFRRGKVTWTDGIAYGLGHGGCEAAWIFISQVIPMAQNGQTGLNMMLGTWERLSAMMIQIGFSFVILYGLKNKKIRYLGVAVLLHTIVDFLIILGNIWIVEGLVTLEAVIAMVLVLRQRKTWDCKTQKKAARQTG